MHDFLVSVRGADQVFLEMCDLWPEGGRDFLGHRRRSTEGRFADRSIHTSFLQRMRPTARTFRALLPLYPTAMESFDLSAYDLVISSSSAWAHGVIGPEQTVHVSYCHNPFVTPGTSAREGRSPSVTRPVARAALRGFLKPWREWDWIAAQRVDRYVTNSEIRAGASALLRARVADRLSAGSPSASPRPTSGRPLRGAVGD